VARGNTACNDGNGNAGFCKEGGRAARRQQWWGNKLVGLVLKVHMGKKFDSYANYQGQIILLEPWLPTAWCHHDHF